MNYKRDDFTGFTLKIFKVWIEFVFLKNFLITIAFNIGKQNGHTYRLLDIGNYFYKKS